MNATRDFYERRLNLTRQLENLYGDMVIDSDREGPGDLVDSYRAINTVVQAIYEMADGYDTAACALRAIQAIGVLASERNP